VAVTDGKQDTTQPGSHAEALAVVVYDVVVNSSAGVNGLTTAQLQGIYNGTYRDWNQLRGGASLPIRIVGRDHGSGGRELFEQSVLHTGEPGLTSNGCLTLDRGVQAPVIRCERDNNAQEIQTISQTPGAIGYSDAPSAASARKSNAVTALTIDNKAFDINTAVESGYPFWTVEYFYSLGEPASNTLVGALVDYLRISDSVHARIAEAGYVPCARQAGAMLDLCNRR
jgi:phosphate transport system substrate-binding protein